MANTFGDVFLDLLKVHPFTSVPITYGAQTGFGFDFTRGAGVRSFAGDTQAIVEETGVSVKYGDFTNLQQDQTITVDSTSYQIRRVENTDDAHVIRITLADA